MVMAVECVQACERAGCPPPNAVRLALAFCTVKDLGVVHNMLAARCGPLRPTRRQDLLDAIEMRVALCERTGAALFSPRAVSNMLATSDLRQKAKTALHLDQWRLRSSAGSSGAEKSVVRVYPTDDFPGGVLAPAQLTVPELFERRFAGDTARGAKSTATLDSAAAQLPFYDLAGPWASVDVFSLAFGMPQILGGPVATEDGSSLRVLLCFLASPPQDDNGASGGVADELPTVGGKNYLVWPPASSTVRIGGKVVARRGKDALPVDITDSLREMGRLTVTGPRKGVPLLGMKAVAITCHFDSQSASGDAGHFLRTHSVDRRTFVPKTSGRGDVVELGFYRIPLTCPLSMCRIVVPVRTVTCNHAQCFDLASLLMAGATAGTPKWQCPTCSEPATPDKLEIDPVILHAIESGTRSKFIDLDVGGAMWRELTGETWRNPAKEQADRDARRMEDCIKFWSEGSAATTVPRSPTTGKRRAVSRGEVVPLSTVAEYGFASAGKKPVENDAAMAFWLDLSPDEGEGDVRDDVGVTNCVCHRCHRVAVPPGHELCTFCYVN